MLSKPAPSGRRGSIAFYMPDLSGGGVERMRLSLIQALRDRGREVTLVVRSDRGPLKTLLPDDLPIVVLGGGRTLSGIAPLAKFLRQQRPDVLVASLDHNNIAALIANVASSRATRVVICQHNALSAEAGQGWKYRIVPFLYRALHATASGIVAVSDGVAEDLAQCTGIDRGLITTIHNPVIDEGFARRAACAAPHPWLSDEPPPVFVFAGRLSPQKDPLTLLRAFALLLQARPARLILIGEGPLMATLRQEVVRLNLGETVVFVGFQTNPLPWIAHAAALVLSSRYEGLGNVIIEALACGTPVVATDCPWGPAEILRDGVFGILAPPEDAEALSAAMRRCLTIEWDRDALRARGAAFSAAACAERHLALFDAIEAGRREGSARTILGVKMSAKSAAETVATLFAEAPRDAVRLVVTPNLDHVRQLRRQDFKAAYAWATLCCPDGFPVLLYARLRGLRLRGRVTGCEIFHRVASHPDLAGQRLFLIVESAGTARAVAAWAASRGLAGQVRAIAAPHDLARDDAAMAALVAAARAQAPTLLFVTLGAPLSEVFIHRNRDALPPCWALCVGQAVRVELGLARRAPARWQSLGLEWLWRLRQEPARLAGRYLQGLAWFPVAILLDLRDRAAARR